MAGCIYNVASLRIFKTVQDGKTKGTLPYRTSPSALLLSSHRAASLQPMSNSTFLQAFWQCLRWTDLGSPP